MVWFLSVFGFCGDAKKPGRFRSRALASVRDPGSVFPPVWIVHGWHLAHDADFTAAASTQPGQAVAHQRRREARHRDASGLGGMVEERDEVTLKARRVVRAAGTQSLLSEFEIPRRESAWDGEGRQQELQLPP